MKFQNLFLEENQKNHNNFRIVFLASIMFSFFSCLTILLTVLLNSRKNRALKTKTSLLDLHFLFLASRMGSILVSL